MDSSTPLLSFHRPHLVKLSASKELAVQLVEIAVLSGNDKHNGERLIDRVRAVPFPRFCFQDDSYRHYFRLLDEEENCIQEHPVSFVNLCSTLSGVPFRRDSVATN